MLNMPPQGSAAIGKIKSRSALFLRPQPLRVSSCDSGKTINPKTSWLILSLVVLTLIWDSDSTCGASSSLAAVLRASCHCSPSFNKISTSSLWMSSVNAADRGASSRHNFWVWQLLAAHRPLPFVTLAGTPDTDLDWDQLQFFSWKVHLRVSRLFTLDSTSHHFLPSNCLTPPTSPPSVSPPMTFWEALSTFQISGWHLYM